MIISSQSSTTVSLANRAIQYGDGCFTTIRVSNGQPELFSYHIERLKNDTAALRIAFKDWVNLQRAVKNEAIEMGDGVIKVLLSRGEGGRGYGTQGVSSPQALLSQHPLPAGYREWQKEGIFLAIAKHTLAKQPALAGLKHLNRLEQVLVKQELADSGCDDLLVCDSDGFLVEASAANLFWSTDAGWFTPDLSFSGVNGVMRNHVLATMKALDIDCYVVKAKPQVLLDAKSICITNALLHLVPVKALRCQGQTKRYSLSQVYALQDEMESSYVE